jgi:DNA-3-methyladenine glycosylase II
MRYRICIYTQIILRRTYPLKMPLTRSTSQKSLDSPSVPREQTVLEDNFSTTATPLRRNKRTLVDGVPTPLRTPTPRKKAKNGATTASPVGAPETPVKPIPVFQLSDASLDPSRMIPGKLSFAFEDAKKHLISVDQRFETLFERLICKPFQNLEPVDPFR